MSALSSLWKANRIKADSPCFSGNITRRFTAPDGRLSRIAIITTNSCTNIKTYANLKYMNQIYLRDQFLMIRDGDGKNRTELAAQLCRYYEARNLEDVDHLPRVTPKMCDPQILFF